MAAILQGLQHSYSEVKKLDYEIVEILVAAPDVGFSSSQSTARDAEGNSKGNFKWVTQPGSFDLSESRCVDLIWVMLLHIKRMVLGSFAWP